MILSPAPVTDQTITTLHLFNLMATLVLFNKPFQVLTQFTDTSNRQTLADFITMKKVYPAGRLDYDSEGLLLLTDNGKLQQHISDPQFKLAKTYWVQVEGEPDEKAVKQLCQGVTLKDGMTREAKVSIIQEPNLWTRTPPIRERKNTPTHWLSITISEGRNRQVRRMTAAVGLPTLRLVRSQIGNWTLGNLQPGEYQTKTVAPPPAAAHKKQQQKRTYKKSRH